MIINKIISKLNSYQAKKLGTSIVKNFIEWPKNN